MSFIEIFSSSSEPEKRPGQEFVRRPWLGQPEDELGVCVNLGLVLGRSTTGVVALSYAVAYSSGVYLELRALARSLRRSEMQRLFHEQHIDEIDPEEGLPDAFLRIGLELPGGERVSNLGRRTPWMHEEEPRRPVFHQAGGGGGHLDDHTVALRPGYWLWPLPSPGTIRISCEWPLVDISLATAEIDADALRDAASRATPLWEEDA